MQRVGADSQTLNHLPLLGLLVVYESLSTVYPYLPPLFGFFMALLVAEGTKKHMLWVLAYFLFLEADRSYMIFSSWIFMVLFFKFLVPVLKDNIVCVRCINVLTVVLAYVGYYLFLEVGGFLMGVGFHSPDYLFVAYYILVELVLAVFFL